MKKTKVIVNGIDFLFGFAAWIQLLETIGNKCIITK